MADIPRLAYVVLAHQTPAQIQRLARRLSNTGRVYLHLDANMPPALYAETVSDLPSEVTLVRREPCFWGGFGIVQATLNGIEAALASGGWSHLFLLSGQCYPIKTDSDIANHCNTHREISWVQHFPVPSLHSWQEEKGGLLRFTRAHFYDAPNPFLRRWLPRFSRRGFSLPRRPPPDLPLFGGSQFWGLSHEAARYVSDFCHARPEMVRYFRYVAIPDEHFIQTVLGGSPLAQDGQIVCDTPHYLAWNEHTKRPVALNQTHLSFLLQSSALFARKFVQGESDSLIALLENSNEGATLS